MVETKNFLIVMLIDMLKQRSGCINVSESIVRNNDFQVSTALHNFLNCLL